MTMTDGASQPQGLRRPSPPTYFRDGVSEGQFDQVLNTEVVYLRKLLKDLNNQQDWTGKLTVVVASKRHHIRAFPEDNRCADRKGNPLPGVLIERDVTDPHGWDFYLYSQYGTCLFTEGANAGVLRPLT
ncbi:hypothetical protein KEM52_005858 [Ascosphaera acerosa]|nr:hypothetical protein KEM52_005858 [Ascosphaera acerosa]